ncbi:hypothetical protein L3X38_026597 [Prunus dulcis]|uniref:Uncharacterized protein n=1 Tax=Prunus dulcis TaxID=3755 RepID=A0AAD4YZG9_PRUDU|nr:hypothetical protein L3X38_026597 [Prunus dulcis]
MKRFVVNLHRVTSEAHFQKWWPTYASAIPVDVHVKLINTADTKGDEEKAADEVAVEEDGAEKGIADGMVADVMEQTARAAKGTVNRVDAEEFADQGSPAEISE